MCKCFRTYRKLETARKRQVKEMEKNTVVFALTSSVELANEIVETLGIPLGQCEVKHFADGEILIELGESVRGKNVYIIQSTCRPVSSNLMELLIAVDACKRASAAHIAVVIPYFGYARQDRKAKPRQPITSKLIAGLFERAGAQRILTVELHATQIQGFFNIPADDIGVISILGTYFKQLHLEDVVVVTPNHSGTTRARKLADILHAPIAIIDNRSKADGSEIMHLIGEVDGKIAVMVDDIVNTGETITAGAKTLYEKGAVEVYASCIHGVLSENAIPLLKEANLSGFVCTNTINQDEHQALYPEMTVLSVGSILANVIKAMEDRKPVSEVVAEFSEH